MKRTTAPRGADARFVIRNIDEQAAAQSIVHPCQGAIYLSRELTDSSLPEIGKYLDGRDHTSVIHARRDVRQSSRAGR